MANLKRVGLLLLAVGEYHPIGLTASMVWGAWRNSPTFSSRRDQQLEPLWGALEDGAGFLVGGVGEYSRKVISSALYRPGPLGDVFLFCTFVGEVPFR